MDELSDVDKKKKVMTTRRPARLLSGGSPSVQTETSASRLYERQCKPEFFVACGVSSPWQ